MELICLDKYPTTNLRLILTKLFKYFVTCDENQSNNGNVISAKYIMAKYVNDKVGMAENIKSEFTKLCEPYFDTVDVTVVPTDGALFSLDLNATVTKGNKTTTLSREMLKGSFYDKLEELRTYTKD